MCMLIFCYNRDNSYYYLKFERIAAKLVCKSKYHVIELLLRIEPLWMWKKCVKYTAGTAKKYALNKQKLTNKKQALNGILAVQIISIWIVIILFITCTNYNCCVYLSSVNSAPNFPYTQVWEPRRGTCLPPCAPVHSTL